MTTPIQPAPRRRPILPDCHDDRRPMARDLAGTCWQVLPEMRSNRAKTFAGITAALDLQFYWQCGKVRRAADAGRKVHAEAHIAAARQVLRLRRQVAGALQ